ncbi:MAG: ROK family protein [Bryobacteraceae bacterium]
MVLRPAEAIGVDIGGTRTRVALVAGGEIVGDTLREFPTSAFSDGDALVHMVNETAARIRSSSARGIGVSVPGLLRDDLAAVEFCPNTPILEGYPLRERFLAKTGLRVVLEVDCNAAALAECRFGEGVGLRRVVVISLGTGVGVGVVDGGAVLRVTGGCCGDLGHVFVGGEKRCTAGCRGCLESVVSVEALGGAGDCAAMIENARSGNPRACATLASVGRSVGIAAASIASFLRPDLILLAGGISEAGESLTKAANDAFREHGAPFYQCEIRKARLGSNAALVGAAASIEEKP